MPTCQDAGKVILVNIYTSPSFSSLKRSKGAASALRLSDTQIDPIARVPPDDLTPAAQGLGLTITVMTIGTCSLWGRFGQQRPHRPGRTQPACRRRPPRIPVGRLRPGASRLSGVGRVEGSILTPTPPTLPLTRVGAGHSDPSRHSTRPFPGRLPIPAHGPS